MEYASWLFPLDHTDRSDLKYNTLELNASHSTGFYTVMRKLFPAQNPEFFSPETNILRLRYLPFLIFVITDCSRLFPVRFVFLWLSPFLVYPTILWVAFYNAIILYAETDYHHPPYSISSCKPWYLKKRRQRTLCVS